ncbi:MAG: ribosome biogenesis GTP-binding protein YihA/YsxC [Candidatus Rokuibacteriota bacterium]
MKIESAEFVASAYGEAGFRRDGRPEVAFVGRSNVGKSSLLNRLLGRKALARTGGTPGRTRAVNYFLINRRLYFVDLPGYGWARAGRAERRRWAELVDRYLAAASPRALVVLLVDSKVGATPLDAQAFDYLTDLGADVVIAATKIDRVPRSQRQRAVAGIRQALGLQAATDVVPVSAQTGEGTGELWKRIESRLAGASGA